jgi:CelD/BcsL family acetyltransferase involved in cellulose biosynthesis
LFFEADRLVGVAPLFEERLQLGPARLSTLRVVGCDHGVTTCAPVIAAAQLPRAIVALADSAEAAGNDMLHWGPFGGYNDQVDSIVPALGRCGAWRVHVRQCAPQMLFDVPSTFDDYLDQLPKKRRYEFRHEEKRLGKSAPLSRTIPRLPGDIEAAFTQFVDMHQSYWIPSGRLGHFGDWPHSEDFHRSMLAKQAERGRGLLCETRSGSELLASEYCYHFGPRLHWVLTARQPEVGGRLGFGEMIKECCSRGVREIDAMRGYYDYKKWMGARTVHQRCIVGVRDGFASRLRTGAFRGASFALDRLYYKLWFSRLAPRLPVKRKPLWPLWIRSRL